MNVEATNYHLKVINNSTNTADFCVFQQDPDLGVPNVMPLAWFTKLGHPTTTLDFSWAIDYSFVWSETGQLKPGVVFEASQVWPADPTSLEKNQVQFSLLDEAYTFEHGPASPNPQKGSLYIKENPDLPLRHASVGIGMSGSGTFAVDAQPNTVLTFTPHPTYWLTAGTFQAGEVLDVQSIYDGAVEIGFPTNVARMTAILNEDNTWTVQPTAEVDFAEIKADHARRRRLERAYVPA